MRWVGEWNCQPCDSEMFLTEPELTFTEVVTIAQIVKLAKKALGNFNHQLFKDPLGYSQVFTHIEF